MIDSFPSQFVLPPCMNGGVHRGTTQPDFRCETSCSFTSLPCPRAATILGGGVQTGPPKMAVYSLTGSANSPLLAEPDLANGRREHRRVKQRGPDGAIPSGSRDGEQQWTFARRILKHNRFTYYDEHRELVSPTPRGRYRGAGPSPDIGRWGDRLLARRRFGKGDLP